MNGVLFTGGDVSLTPSDPYYAAIQTIYHYVIEANNQGKVIKLLIYNGKKRIACESVCLSVCQSCLLTL